MAGVWYQQMYSWALSLGFLISIKQLLTNPMTFGKPAKKTSYMTVYIIYLKSSREIFIKKIST